MKETPATTQKANGFISTRLRVSGMLIIAGLAVEGLSLVWNHPLSFVAFLGLGGLLLAAGIVLYLWTLVAAAAA
jgi:asparagine N-glycosylation enzyme membrane subunit Stt3